MEPIWIDSTSTESVREVLALCGVIQEDEQIGELSSAGEGNMNIALRAKISGASGSRSIIVKQSRSYVAKYRQIPAPIERVAFESAFYDFVDGDEALAARMPRRLVSNSDHFLLVLEDLGPAADATSWYQAAPSNIVGQVAELLDWLFTLHQGSQGKVDCQRFGNHELRALNHVHIFDLPFQDPAATDLEQFCVGLSKASLEVRSDQALRRAALQLGELYLGSGNCLLHGDYYPGSWLVGGAQPMVIDPEFCFAGPREFDLGIMLGHLQLIGHTEAIRTFEQQIETHSTSANAVNLELMHRFASVEVLRRLLGVAQLPLGEMSLDRRMELITNSSTTLKGH